MNDNIITVSELIERLSAFDKSLPIVICGPYASEGCVEGLRVHDKRLEMWSDIMSG